MYCQLKCIDIHGYVPNKLLRNLVADQLNYHVDCCN